MLEDETRIWRLKSPDSQLLHEIDAKFSDLRGSILHAVCIAFRNPRPGADGFPCLAAGNLLMIKEP